MVEITIEQIKRDLETAAYVDRIMPPVLPPRYKNCMPEIVYTPQEVMFMAQRPLKIRPTQAQLDVWEKVVLKWLPLLTVFEKSLVWKRANRIPWKILCRDFGRTRIHLYQLHKIALLKIQYDRRQKRSKCSEQKST